MTDAAVKFIAEEVRGRACKKCLFRDESFKTCTEMAALAVRAGMPDCDDPCRKGWTIIYQLAPLDPRQPDLF